jgi:diaminopimelate decarboxylase
MNIVPAQLKPALTAQTYDVVGPVCETGDFLGKDRALAIEPGDLLVVRSAGAYGFTMSSNYNSRLRAAEVLVDGEQVHLVRQREQWQDLWRGEQLLPA